MALSCAGIRSVFQGLRCHWHLLGTACPGHVAGLFPVIVPSYRVHVHIMECVLASFLLGCDEEVQDDGTARCVLTIPTAVVGTLLQ
jgi:hypothetical protein